MDGIYNCVLMVHTDPPHVELGWQFVCGPLRYTCTPFPTDTLRSQYCDILIEALSQYMDPERGLRLAKLMILEIADDSDSAREVFAELARECGWLDLKPAQRESISEIASGLIYEQRRNHAA